MTGVLRDPRRGGVPRTPRRGGAPNLGPRAAAGNRAALLAAAREVFGSAGTGAPLSAVAKRAGVGQGSLYRHFPERLDLVVAVFEEQVVAVEELAADPGVGLPDLLGLVTQHAVDSVAFVDLVRPGVSDGRLDALGERVAVVLGTRLDGAIASGQAPRGTTPDDLLLAVSMVAGGLSGVGESDRMRRAERAWELLRFELRIPAEPGRRT